MKVAINICAAKIFLMLDVEFGGVLKDPWGNAKAGFTINGKINRKDWNLNWNAALEGGGILVSEDVKINCEVQLLNNSINNFKPERNF
jgi:hypothetical protein